MKIVFLVFVYLSGIKAYEIPTRNERDCVEKAMQLNELPQNRYNSDFAARCATVAR